VTTFALVHGAWHGAWCWERVVPELAARGHRAITMDLPCEDPTATFSTYADVVCDAVGDEDIVLVGHSLAGLTIPLVAARRPVTRLVFLCALVPQPGRSFAQQTQDEDDMLGKDYAVGLSELDQEGRRRWVDESAAHTFLFADCDARTATAAFERLRPQAVAAYSVPCPLDELPSVPATYVLCTEDRLVMPDWSRRAAGPRLGADLVELPGSHSPSLSRPGELAAVLDRLA
jgi:pimeloyl-ACP methyl ester carboxylesterase